MYVFSIVLIVVSNILYNVCQKSTPQKANPFITLLITYVTASIFALVAFKFYKTDKGFFQSLTELNWTSIALGFSIVGIEFGYLMAYRTGWNIGIGSLLANIILAIVLIPIGVLFFKDGFGVNKIFGVLFCIIGLILMNK